MLLFPGDYIKTLNPVFSLQFPFFLCYWSKWKRKSEIICISGRWFIERPKSFPWCHREQRERKKHSCTSNTDYNLLEKLTMFFGCDRFKCRNRWYSQNSQMRRKRPKEKFPNFFPSEIKRWGAFEPLFIWYRFLFVRNAEYYSTSTFRFFSIQFEWHIERPSFNDPNSWINFTEKKEISQFFVRFEMNKINGNGAHIFLSWKLNWIIVFFFLVASAIFVVIFSKIMATQ